MRKNSRNMKHQKNMNLFKSPSVVILIIIFVLAIIAISYNIYSSNQLKSKISNNELDDFSKNYDEKTDVKSDKEETNVTFTMAAIGDIMCHNTQYWDAYNKETDEYDFSYVFENIIHYTSSADITIGSLETSFAGKERGYSNYPIFNSPDNLAYSIKNIGVDVLSTAGNHCLDMGFSGLSRTIDVLDDAGISHLGTYKTRRR